MDTNLAETVFRSSMIDVYMKCSKAINERNWPLLARYLCKFCIFLNDLLIFCFSEYPIFIHQENRKST